jgi:hypothetical protein
MARAGAILKALATAYRRDWTALQSLTGNNFFLMTLFLLGKAGSFVYLILGLVVLFPLSTDPLRKIPASRLALWPLSRRELWVLRLAGPWINPLTWILAAGAAWSAGRTISAGLWAIIGGLFVVAFALSHLPSPGHLPMFRRMPQIPGPLGQLVRKNLREILTTLDFYCAAVLSASVLVWRLSGVKLPEEAFMAMTVLTVGALSSYAQCLFGLDGLILPLAPVAAIGGALVVLAVGHSPAVEHPREQTRWRFTTGGALGNGFVQMVAMAMTVSTIFSMSAWVLLAAVAVWAISLWWYGRELEKSL